MLRKHRLPALLRPVEVKASAEDTYVGDVWKVGKGSLVETTRQVLQEGRMTFDEQMPPEVMATNPPVRAVYQALLSYPFERARRPTRRSRRGRASTTIWSWRWPWRAGSASTAGARSGCARGQGGCRHRPRGRIIE
jgi:hypothetical protein